MSRPKPPEDPRELMNQALRLISKDLDFIEQLGQDKKLDGDAALCLVRYSDALLKFVNKEEEDQEAEKRKTAKMSTAELVARAEEFAAAARAKAPK